MISDIANIVTALGTIVMTGVAWFALRTWRKEFIGKKKIELAEEIMAAVLEFQDILINARMPENTLIEINEIKKWLVDVNNAKSNIPGSMQWPLYPDRLHYLLPFHRLNKHANQIDDFRNIFNKSLMYWPEDLCRLLYELISFLERIRRASETLYEHSNLSENLEIVFADTPDNKITKRIFDIGEEI